jgi:acylphosphatase
MKTYIAHYNSDGNIFEGKVAIDAESSSEAMDKFFTWLKKQTVWPHLWRIDISLYEEETIEKI